MAHITFKALTEGDRPMLRQWLETPHAREWWGNPDEELNLIYDGKGEHEAFIACANGEAIAYVQAWRPSQHPDLPWQHGMTSSTRGIDITIGKPENLGRGLGSLILRHFAARLFAEGASRIVIDPDIRNERAIAAYLKAGFTPYDQFKTGDGTDLLMELLPEDIDYGSGHDRN